MTRRRTNRPQFDALDAGARLVTIGIAAAAPKIAATLQGIHTR